MTPLDLNLYAYIGCRRNISIYADYLVGVPNEKYGGHTGVGLVPRSGCPASLTLLPYFLQTAPDYTSNLGYLAQ